MNQTNYTVFIEYTIEEKSWREFEALATSIYDHIKHCGPILDHSVLISNDQPRLVLEIVKVANLATVEHIRKRRKEPKMGIMGQLDAMIQGGLEGIRIWTFQQFR
jgi:hypothetical protein